MTTRRRRLLAGPAVLVAAAVVAVVVGTVLRDGRQDIDLRMLLDETGGYPAYLPDAQLATDTLCRGSNPCTQAVESRTATVFSYETQEQAAAAARSWGEDGYHSSWIAIHFEDGGLSGAQRLELGRALDGTNTTSPD